MVDLTRDEHGRTQARLLDLVPGRSGETYKSWLRQALQLIRRVVLILKQEAILEQFAGADVDDVILDRFPP